MLPELSSIQRLRKSLDLTQQGLASLCGVSQSLIAKIESGKIDPSYSHARKVLEALESLQKKGERKASDVMSKHVFFASPSDSLSKAISLMRSKNISQLPVIERSQSVGSVSDRGIVDLLERNPSLRVDKVKVREVMEEPFPVVSSETPLSAITALLHSAPAVLVLKNRKIGGIVAKADLLKTV